MFNHGFSTIKKHKTSTDMPTAEGRGRGECSPLQIPILKTVFSSFKFFNCDPKFSKREVIFWPFTPLFTMPKIILNPVRKPGSEPLLTGAGVGAGFGQK